MQKGDFVLFDGFGITKGERYFPNEMLSFAKAKVNFARAVKNDLLCAIDNLRLKTKEKINVYETGKEVVESRNSFDIYMGYLKPSRNGEGRHKFTIKAPFDVRNFDMVSFAYHGDNMDYDEEIFSRKDKIYTRDLAAAYLSNITGAVNIISEMHEGVVLGLPL